MVDAFLLVGLPYLAITLAIVGSVWRLRAHRFSYSARSSQFLEHRQLRLGSGPWHIGIMLVLFGHLVAFLLPGVWMAVLAIPGALVLIEVIGMGAAILSLIGLALLIARRVTSGRVQAVTTTMDLVVAGLLLVQVALGIHTALMFRYGAQWGVGTAVPYLWSLLSLRPDMTLVADLPVVFKLHLALAWVLILLLPFTRLIHLLALPVSYLWRAPQLVIWTTRRRGEQPAQVLAEADSRREFLKGGLGLAGASGLLALGVSEKAVNFFKGPTPDEEAESMLLQKKLARLQLSAEERSLELERRRSAFIQVVRQADLSDVKGHYFIDYDMAPGLAFKGPDGWPLVRSAKCTHLGCTVGSEIDAQGRILCPCHISYFDVRTGRPNDGAPARLPLPELGWALMDGAGTVVAQKEPGQPIQGATDPALLVGCTLFLTKPADRG